MSDGMFFKGTSSEQDGRFGNKERRLLKSMKFPSQFSSKVDMTKVNLSVIKPWVSARIQEIIGIEDEVVTEFVFGLLEEQDPDPRTMQVNLTGFLETQTPMFMSELWALLISAQASPGGIPARFIEEKKEELRKKKADEEKMRSSIDAARSRALDVAPSPTLPHPPVHTALPHGGGTNLPSGPSLSHNGASPAPPREGSPPPHDPYAGGDPRDQWEGSRRRDDRPSSSRRYGEDQPRYRDDRRGAYDERKSSRRREYRSRSPPRYSRHQGYDGGDYGQRVEDHRRRPSPRSYDRAERGYESRPRYSRDPSPSRYAREEEGGRGREETYPSRSYQPSYGEGSRPEDRSYRTGHHRNLSRSGSEDEGMRDEQHPSSHRYSLSHKRSPSPPSGMDSRDEYGRASWDAPSDLPPRDWDPREAREQKDPAEERRANRRSQEVEGHPHGAASAPEYPSH